MIRAITGSIYCKNIEIIQNDVDFLINEENGLSWSIQYNIHRCLYTCYK